MKRVSIFIITLFFAVRALAYTVPLDPSLTESPVLVKTFSGSISGSLVVPTNATEKIPVVLIMADSGPVDRDGNNPDAGINGDTYKLLANELGKSGIASLRYDKRRVGKSVSVTKESELRIDDYGDDAVSLIGFLNDDGRFSKIVLFGHGEGSLVGMIAIIDQPVAGFISAEGAADQADKIMLNQMKSKPKFLIDEFQTVLDSLRKGKLTPGVDPAIYYIARPSIQNFLMSWCRCVPIRGIKAIKKPVMIIHGDNDLQIPVENAEKLKKAKSDATLLIIKEMNHWLKEAPADPDKNMAASANPATPLKTGLSAGIVGFINKLK